MIEAAVEALTLIMQPERFGWLVLGVLIGLIVGVLPGMGGVAGFSIVIPFIYGMDRYSGIALLLGLSAVTSTSDTYTSVLLGVPGSSSSQATIMDGYPLSRQGKAGLALGASFVSSMIGGLIGAVILFAILPLARPLVLSIAAPQLFALALFGIAMVGVISRATPLPGLIAGAIGLLLSAVGPAPAGGYRYIMGFDYLWTGVSLGVIALGLFAIPELVSLFREGDRIAEGRTKLAAGLFDGAREAMRHKSLIAKSSSASVALAMIPALGGAVIQWIIYGATVQFSKDKEKFGKGDIRGVISVEASNNAVDAGALVPTILFGIPGNGSTALLLGAFIILGIDAGPTMLETSNLPLVLTIVWTLAIANILATAACFVASNGMIRLSLISSRKLVPLLTAIVVLAAFQTTQRVGDFVLLLVMGALGMIMKALNWPRPAILIGFVLGTAMERYLRISIDRYGGNWVTDPIVMAIGFLTLLVVIYSFIGSARDSLTRFGTSRVAAVPPSDGEAAGDDGDAPIPATGRADESEPGRQGDDQRDQ